MKTKLCCMVHPTILCHGCGKKLCEVCRETNEHRRHLKRTGWYVLDPDFKF